MTQRDYDQTVELPPKGTEAREAVDRVLAKLNTIAVRRPALPGDALRPNVQDPRG